MALHAARQEPGDDRDWRARVDATMQHLALLKRKEERLRAAREEAEAQLIHTLAGAYNAGLVDISGVCDLHAEYVAVAAEGKRARWNAGMPFSANWNRIQHLTRAPDKPPLHEPNGPHGSWQGDSSLGYCPAPPRGACVVYVLFDAANVPCYVGSTMNFRGRMSSHRRAKEFARWVAYPCKDREGAYELEERLLAEHKPYLNKKAGR